MITRASRIVMEHSENHVFHERGEKCCYSGTSNSSVAFRNQNFQNSILTIVVAPLSSHWTFVVYSKIRWYSRFFVPQINFRSAPMKSWYNFTLSHHCLHHLLAIVSRIWSRGSCFNFDIVSFVSQLLSYLVEIKRL